MICLTDRRASFNIFSVASFITAMDVDFSSMTYARCNLTPEQPVRVAERHRGWGELRAVARVFTALYIKEGETVRTHSSGRAELRPIEFCCRPQVTRPQAFEHA